MYFETKYRIAQVKRIGINSIVQVFDRKTKQLLHTYHLRTVPDDFTSYTALVKYAKANQLTLSTSELLEASKNLDSSVDSVIPFNVPASQTIGDTLFIDVETTGLGYRDEVIEIAIVDVRENVLFNSLIKPSKPISPQSTKIHGITNEMVKDAPSFLQVWKKILNIVKDKDLYFYNCDFDCRMIMQSFDCDFKSKSSICYKHLFKCKSVNCLMIDYAEFWGEYSIYHGSYAWQKLIEACIQQNISIDDVPNHRALGDAVKTSRLWSKRGEWTHLNL